MLLSVSRYQGSVRTSWAVWGLITVQEELHIREKLHVQRIFTLGGVSLASKESRNRGGEYATTTRLIRLAKQASQENSDRNSCTFRHAAQDLDRFLSKILEGLKQLQGESWQRVPLTYLSLGYGSVSLISAVIALLLKAEKLLLKTR